jgi:hypothetical protein
MRDGVSCSRMYIYLKWNMFRYGHFYPRLIEEEFDKLSEKII